MIANRANSDSNSLPSSDDPDCSQPSDTLSDSDSALDTWLALLIAEAAFRNYEHSKLVLEEARSNRHSMASDEKAPDPAEDKSTTYVYRPLKPNSQVPMH